MKRGCLPTVRSELGRAEHFVLGDERDALVLAFVLLELFLREADRDPVLMVRRIDDLDHDAAVGGEHVVPPRVFRDTATALLGLLLGEGVAETEAGLIFETDEDLPVDPADGFLQDDPLDLALGVGDDLAILGGAEDLPDEEPSNTSERGTDDPVLFGSDCPTASTDPGQDGLAERLSTHAGGGAAGSGPEDHPLGGRGLDPLPVHVSVPVLRAGRDGSRNRDPVGRHDGGLGPTTETSGEEGEDEENEVFQGVQGIFHSVPFKENEFWVVLERVSLGSVFSTLSPRIYLYYTRK